jgi:lysophospholipase L1-like esterase
MKAKAALAASTLAVLGSACGGGSPAGPSGGGETHAVSAVVYYDENGSGALEAGEDSRLGGVTVSVGGRTARTDNGTGHAVVSGVPAGPQTAQVSGLLPFFVPGAATAVTVPASGDVLLSATLPIGNNQPHTYMAFGDSITLGEGSRQNRGYTIPLESALRGFFGDARILNEGQSGTKSSAGASRIGGTLRRDNPAYTLILYGTNDWNECGMSVPCFTIESLRRIVTKTKMAHSLPVLATIPPANPVANPAGRNVWVSNMNELIRDLADEEGALLVDIEAAFLAEGNLVPLFEDHVHPNDRGYGIIASAFFEAITQPDASDASFDDFVVPLLEPTLEPPLFLPDLRRDTVREFRGAPTRER